MWWGKKRIRGKKRGGSELIDEKKEKTVVGGGGRDGTEVERISVANEVNEIGVLNRSRKRYPPTRS